MSNPLNYTIDLKKITSGYDRKTCWVQARAGALPPTTPGGPHTLVATMQKLLLTGSDIFYAIHSTHSTDAGNTWSPLVEQPGFGRQPHGDGETVVCDFWPKYHEKTGTLLGTGHSAYYLNNKIPHSNRPRRTPYAVYDASKMQWRAPRIMDMPDSATEADLFYNAGAGCTQRVDLPDGDILLPIYARNPATGRYDAIVLRCAFDGQTLTYRSRSNALATTIGRGFPEPSLAVFQGEYFLTLRNDESAFVSRSADGVTFSDPVEWTFDNGDVLGSYNTQAHWVTHPQGLFLVYTRRGLGNDHVFRHRAPVVMAQVDTQSLRVIRETERPIVPQRGARLGNFGVTPVSDTESWIIAAEWMQTTAPDHHDSTVCEKYGSDNTVWAARLQWQ